VDLLHVYLNGYDDVPGAVRELADAWVLDSENAGAERKFWWASKHEGIYCSCDDDIVYPPDYVTRLTQELRARAGRGLVTGHGRIYRERAREAHDVQSASIGRFHRRVDNGRLVNHGGTGVMAWDAQATHVPTQWPERNLADMQVAVWAQQNRIPIWLMAHPANWYRPLALIDPHGIFRSSQAEGHRRRNAMIARQTKAGGWVVWP